MKMNDALKFSWARNAQRAATRTPDPESDSEPDPAGEDWTDLQTAADRLEMPRRTLWAYVKRWDRLADRWPGLVAPRYATGGRGRPALEVHSASLDAVRADPAAWSLLRQRKAPPTLEKGAAPAAAPQEPVSAPAPTRTLDSVFQVATPLDDSTDAGEAPERDAYVQSLEREVARLTLEVLRLRAGGIR